MFGQVEYGVARRLRGIFSGRVDHSTLHATRFSPRAALVFSVASQQRLRVSASQAFQSPSVTEFFLSTPVAPPVNLEALEMSLSPLLGGVPLGFSSIPMLARGNAHLKVEQLSSIEVGYSGVVAHRTYVTLTYYRNWLRDFTTNLLPQVGTPLGRVNADFQPYRPPSALPPEAAAIVQAALASALPGELLALLSNAPTGAPMFVAFSVRNFGKAITHGLETAVSYKASDDFSLDLSYTAFDYHIPQQWMGLTPNTPPQQWSVGGRYSTSRVTAGLRYRWVDNFLWSAGLFSGPVPSYGVSDVQVLYAVMPPVSIGIDIDNALNSRHYEVFGGDLLARRALVSLKYGW